MKQMWYRKKSCAAGHCLHSMSPYNKTFCGFLWNLPRSKLFDTNQSERRIIFGFYAMDGLAIFGICSEAVSWRCSILGKIKMETSCDVTSAVSLMLIYGWRRINVLHFWATPTVASRDLETIFLQEMDILDLSTRNFLIILKTWQLHGEIVKNIKLEADDLVHIYSF